MARLYNLARMSTATTGTGTITLGSAVSGFLSFASAGITDGDTITYAIQDGASSEIGRGVYTASGTTLTRSVLKSTNSGAAISLSGTAQVFITPSAEDFLIATNAQTGTTYTVLASDIGKLVTLSNASAIAVTLPQATGAFAAGWYATLSNIGAGTVTITPTTSTIAGAATYVLVSGQAVKIVSDGTNWMVVRGLGDNVRFADAAGIYDDSGNEQLIFQKTASAVNQVDVTNAATGGKPSFAATGDDTNIILRLSGKGTGGVEIEGTATNDSATAGYVGEYTSATVLKASAVSLTTSTTANVTSISLTAGDWDVYGFVRFTGNSSTECSRVFGGVNTTSATLGSTFDQMTDILTNVSVPFNKGDLSADVGPWRLTLSTTTTVYLLAFCVFTVSTAAGFGTIRARRVR